MQIGIMRKAAILNVQRVIIVLLVCWLQTAIASEIYLVPVADTVRPI